MSYVSWPDHAINDARINKLEKLELGQQNGGTIGFYRDFFTTIEADFDVNTDNAFVVFDSNVQDGVDGDLRNAGAAFNQFNRRLQTRFKTADAGLEISISFRYYSGGPITGDTKGLAIGLMNNETCTVVHYDGSTFDAGTNPTGGKLKLYLAKGIAALNSATPKSTSADLIVATTTSFFELTLRVFASGVEGRVTDLSTGKQLFTRFRYKMEGVDDIVPQTSSIAIFHMGGFILANSLVYRTLQSSRPDILCIGDSKTRGYSAKSYPRCYPLQLSSLANAVVSNHSGPGDTTASVLAHAPYLVKYVRGRFVILNIGRNDLSAAVPAATWQANYFTIRNLFVRYGFEVIHLLPLPENVPQQGAIDQTALRNYIIATFSFDAIVDASVGFNTTTMLNGNVHPNALGMTHIANALSAYFVSRGIVF